MSHYSNSYQSDIKNYVWFAYTDIWVNQTLSFAISSQSLSLIVFCCDLITISCPDVWAPFQILSFNIWTCGNTCNGECWICGNTCNGDCPALKLNFYNPWYHFACLRLSLALEPELPATLPLPLLTPKDFPPKKTGLLRQSGCLLKLPPE